MRFFLALLLISSPAFAQTAVSPLPSPHQIGVVAAAKGAVTIQKQGSVGRVVETGEEVHLGDEVSTDATGSLQILLLDETIFTIGPSSSIIIDKFIYDPATQTGKVNAKVVKGVFRFVTGKIARKKPDDMKVDLPSGTIGIRGTIVLGQTQGTKSTVVLLGPGARTNTGHRVGQITVGNESGGQIKKVTVTRAGFGTVIEGEGVPPSEPFALPAEQLAQMAGALESEAGDSGGEGEGGEGSASEQAGQDTAGAEDSAEGSEYLGDFLDNLSEESSNAAQSIIENQQSVADGVASFDDLRRIQTGVFQYSQTGVALTRNGSPTIGKAYSFYYQIDFGARQAGGGGSNSRIDTILDSGNPTYSLPARSFASGSGQASFNESLTFSGGTCSGCSGPAAITVTLNNQNGVPGQTASHSFSQVDTSNTLAGSGTTGPRTEL